MREIVLINITGKDRLGLTASPTKTLAEYNVTILDMGQAVIHDLLSLGILIEIPDRHKSALILKEMLFAAHKLGIAAKFTPIAEERYEDWVNQQV
jgi:phosphoserine phosphatase